MKKLFIYLCLFIFVTTCYGAPPTRSSTYTIGQIIEASDVTANEDVIFSYLSAGVDTYASGSITGTAIQDNSVDISTDTNLSVTTPIVLTNDTISISDVYLNNTGDDTTTGSITALDLYANNNVSGINVVASNTVTGIIVDSQYLEYGGGTSVTVRDNLIVNGTITGLATSFPLTSGDIFVGNSSNVATDVAMSGDVSITNAGVTAVSDDSHAHTTTTISGVDISADTNLTAGDALTLTDDDIDFDGGTAPAGELGGTWALPTVDATHSGSAHHSAVTITDTTTINLTLVGQDVQADGLYTAGDNLTLTGADFDLDASISLTNVTASSTVTGIVVDTQYLEYSAGAEVTVRDAITTASGITVQSGVIDMGSAVTLEIPNGTNPTVSSAGQISADTNDHALRGSDGSNQFIYGQKTVQIDRTIASPLSLTEADTLPIWKNKTPFTFVITGIHSDSDTDNVDFTLQESSATNYTTLTTIEAITIATDGTAVYYDDRTSGIDHTTIEAGNVISFNNDATDAPAYVHFIIVGYFLGNVN